MNNPIINMLNEYKSREYYPWHMPGHKRKLKNIYDNPYLIDVTEVDGTDNLHNPEDGIHEALKRAAKVYGSKESYYLVNGSTSGLLTAIWAATNIGDKVIVARNCHKSVYNGIRMRGLTPAYIYPEYLDNYNMYGGIDVEELKVCIDENADARAIIITSPTYEGIVSDVETIVRLAHRNNMLLIVDEAHGAHFEYSKRFPNTATRLGADIVVESLHKTLAAPTQSAILHSNLTGCVEERLKEGLKMFQSSSPSYILMSGMDYAIGKAIKDSKSNYEKHIDVLENFIKQVSVLKNIKIIDRTQVGKCAYDYDISKIVFSVEDAYKKSGYTGKHLAQQLQEQYGQVFEMSALTYAIGMTSIMDEEENFNNLYNALADIDSKLGEILIDNPAAQYTSFNGNIKASVSKNPSRIIESETIYIPLEESVGKIGGNYVYLYPPGVPIIVPGEVITKDIICCIKEYFDNKLDIKGIKIKNEKIYTNVSSIFR